MLRLVLFSLSLLCFSVNAAASLAVTEPLHRPDAIFNTTLTSDLLIGNPEAKILVIEYSSLTCPHCAYFHKEIFPKLKEHYITPGIAKFVHRDFPLDKASLDGAIIAHCAGKERYYTFLKVLFEKQDSWVLQKNYLEILFNIAKLGGLSQERLDQCFADKNLADTILEAKLAAIKAANLNSTPTFFINGKEHRGISDWHSFSKSLQEQLKQ
ncbi:MAG: DsbA family protein [Burkholderiales bacterium]